MTIGSREALEAALEAVQLDGFEAFADALELEGDARAVARLLFEHAAEHGVEDALRVADGHREPVALTNDQRRMNDLVSRLALEGGPPVSTAILVARLDWAPAKVIRVGEELRGLGLIR